MNKHTDTQTDTHTHIWTFRLIESIGPEGRCFENFNRKISHEKFHLTNFTKKFYIQLQEVGAKGCLNIRNPWGKVMETTGLRFENFYS